jgi:hypothetical protein
MIAGKDKNLALGRRGHRIPPTRGKPTREILEATERARRLSELKLAGARGIPCCDIDRR